MKAFGIAIFTCLFLSSTSYAVTKPQPEIDCKIPIVCEFWANFSNTLGCMGNVDVVLGMKGYAAVQGDELNAAIPHIAHHVLVIK